MEILNDVTDWVNTWKPSITTKRSVDGRVVVVGLTQSDISVEEMTSAPGLRIHQSTHIDGTGNAPASLAALIKPAFERLVLGLGGLVDGSMEEVDSGWVLTLSTTLYVDGITQHSVLQAVDNQRKAARALELLIEDVKAQHELNKMLNQQLGGREGGSDDIVESVPSIDEVQVEAGTELVGDERETLATLDADVWYETLGEARGWIEVISDGGAFGWVPAERVVERRSRPVGPFASPPEQPE